MKIQIEDTDTNFEPSCPTKVLKKKKIIPQPTTTKNVNCDIQYCPDCPNFKQLSLPIITL